MGLSDSLVLPAKAFHHSLGEGANFPECIRLLKKSVLDQSMAPDRLCDAPDQRFCARPRAGNRHEGVFQQAGMFSEACQDRVPRASK
jgi:hypothetical protein